MLNVVLFGKTGTCKSESYNAVLINRGRTKRANGIASTVGGTAVTDIGNSKFK